MSKPTALFLFNSSTTALQPWLDSGEWDVVSVDFDSTDHAGSHRTYNPIDGLTRLNVDLSLWNASDVVDAMLVARGLAAPSFVLSFAPCTDLAVSGAAHFKAKAAKNANFQVDAVRMAKLVLEWDCPSIVENPVSVLATMWKRPEYMHPWYFSSLLPEDDSHPTHPDYYPPRDAYNKKTGLWCSNGAVMPVRTDATSDCEGKVNPCHQKLGGKSARTKYIRSLTPRGVAKAIYLANGVK